MRRILSRMNIAAAIAGLLNGMLGAGGGLALIPMLRGDPNLKGRQLFSSSVAIIAPICVISLVFLRPIPWFDAIPYMLGSAIGGTAAGLFGKKVPVSLLHRILGILILWGGIRYLWPSF